MKTTLSNQLIPFLLLLASPLALSQPAKDPFLRGAAPVAIAADQAPQSLSVTYEVYSLPFADASTLLRKGPSDEELRKELLDRVAKDKTKQETLLVVRGLSGQKVDAGGRSEAIFPTEYDDGISNPPQPEKPPAGQATKPAAPLPRTVSPPIASAYETRNCGVQLEVETILSDDKCFASVRLLAEHVTPAGRRTWGQGISQVEMPAFTFQKINTAANTAVGIPCFIGTISPPPPGKQEESSAKRIWLAFITVDLAK